MAAPKDITIKNLNGKWTMNKKLGDDQNDFFVLQGLGWITRNGIKLASVTLTVKQYEQDGTTQIDITQVASGLSTSNEFRVLNWTERDHKDKLFGDLKGKSRFFKRAEFQAPEGMDITDEDRKFLRGEILKDGSASSFTGDDTQIQTVASNAKDGWSVDQVWGFEDIDGERRHTRRMVCRKGDKSERMRVVYDYIGPAN